jgi:hypothetical protein
MIARLTAQFGGLAGPVRLFDAEAGAGVQRPPRPGT